MSPNPPPRPPGTGPDPAPAAPKPGLTPTQRVVRNVGGVLLLLAGIAGLVLPVLQGVLMIVAGLALIDLPIKHRAHAYLMRWRWYQAIARRHAAVHDRWLRWRDERAARKAAEAEVTSRRRER